MSRLRDFFDVLAPNIGDLTSAEKIKGDTKVKKRIDSESPKNPYDSFELVRGSKVFTKGKIDRNSGRFFSEFGFESLVGMRLLDVGSFAGSISFLAEDLGAEVTSIDILNPETTGYKLYHELRNSKATHVTASVYDLDPTVFGEFDLIVFSGVHYHLRHPILALERLNDLLKKNGAIIVVGTTCDFWAPDTSNSASGVVPPPSISAEATSTTPTIPFGMFYSGKYLGDNSNWFVPSTAMLIEWLKSCGFEITNFSLSQMAGPRGVATILAKKISAPSDEYSVDVYSRNRRSMEIAAPIYRTRIPTIVENRN